MITLTILTFLLTIIIILWRPKGLNEAIPATCGALLIILIGSVSIADLIDIGKNVSGPAVTIIATVVMAIVLESFGFFVWAAEGLAVRAKGSGIKLFWYVNILCFLMTVFFNNDGSILITTPILLLLLKQLGLKNHQKIPFLLSGALIATASSAPIGVSNIVNLIALKIVNMDLYKHTELMFVPAMVGLILFSILIYTLVKQEIPRTIPILTQQNWDIDRNHLIHPLKGQPTSAVDQSKRRKMMRNLLLFVFCIRISLFVGSYFGIPESIVAVVGSIVLLGWRWVYLQISPIDMVKKTPWHIFIFAFSMYVLVFGLHNIGLTHLLIEGIQPIAASSVLNASLAMGAVVTFLSTFFNNHPALMVGTIALTSMELDPLALKVTYLASVIGSDFGALLLPIGTLASLIWFSILRQHKVKIEWKEYVRVTIIAVPITLIVTLICLYYWVILIY